MKPKIRIPHFTVDLALSDMVYVSYLLSEDKVRPFVPEVLEFSSPFEERVFVSIVLFRSRHVSVRGLPAIRLSYNQLNVRTYVKDPITGLDSVFFLRSGITSRLTSFITKSLQIPWDYIQLEVTANKDRSGRYTSYEAGGDWRGAVKVSLDADMVAEDEHGGAEENYRRAARFLTSPAIGFFRQGDAVLRFDVEHSMIEPQPAIVRKMEFDVLSGSGLVSVSEISQPYNAIFADRASFSVSMPPQPLEL